MKIYIFPFTVTSVLSGIKESARVSMAATFASGSHVPALKYHLLCFFRIRLHAH